MPRQKQVTFQGNIPGKFIPRDDPPAASVLRSGTHASRFNSKMAELLASSSPPATENNENEPLSNAVKSSEDDPILPALSEGTAIDSSRGQSRLIHRRIVTMLETLRGRGSNSGGGGATSPPTSPRISSSNIESKSQPITFGQLRQVTTTSTPPSSSTIVEEVSSTKAVSTRAYTDFTPVNSLERQSYYASVPSLKTETHLDLTSVPLTTINKSSSKHQANKPRLHYSPSLENLLEQHNVVPRMKDQDEFKQDDKQQAKSPLTVDEILATYYSKVKVPTTTEIQTPPSSQTPSYSTSNMGFHLHPSPLSWNSSQTNQHIVPAPPPSSRLLLNEQNRNRPPPPSYSISIASGHRPPPPTNNLVQHLIRPPAPTSVHQRDYLAPEMTQHLLPGNPSSMSSSSTTTNPSIRPPPPRYESPSTNIERSHSALSSMTRPDYSRMDPPQTGFDREFSRLLYGKEGGKNRHQRQKRKAFSDPVKKSVEEAGRAVEKTHRRLTTHVNKTDTVKEEEESSSDSYEIDKYEQGLFPQRHFHRHSDVIVNNRESAKKRIVPANPLLTRRIPSFLHVYSQASSSNDILLQWHLFSLPELESFDAMMTRLYKDENLARVKLYEMYRALLTSVLASKASSNRVIHTKNKSINDDDDDSITTTAL